MDLSILLNNMNGAAALGWEKNYCIQSWYVDYLMDCDKDIIVITEFVAGVGFDYLIGKLTGKGYIYFYSATSGSNGFLIAIKKKLVKADNEFVTSCYNTAIETTNMLLKVSLPLVNGKSLAVIAGRMLCGTEKDLHREYDNRRRLFDDEMMPAIQRFAENEDCVIFAADMNNARYFGSLDETFNRQDYIDTHGNDYAQINYNLNCLRDEFDKAGFKLVTDGQVTCGIYSLDHIWVKGMGACTCEAPDSSFMTFENGYQSSKRIVGLPDHSIVKAKLTI